MLKSFILGYGIGRGSGHEGVAAPASDRIRRQIRLAFLATAALFILAVVAYAAYALHFEKEAKWRRLRHAANFVAETSSLSFGHYRSGFVMLSRNLADLPGLKDGRATNRVTVLLRTFQRAYPTLWAVAVLGPHGHIWSQVGAFVDRKSPWIRRRLPRAGRGLGRAFIIGRPQHLGGARGLPLWYIVRSQGRVQFAILAILPLAAQQMLWARLALPQGTVLGLLRPDDYLESRWPYEPHAIYRHTVSGALTRAIMQHPIKSAGLYDGMVAVAGGHRLGAYRRLRKYPMLAFASLPVASVFTAWRRLVEGPVVMLWVVLAATYLVYRWTLRRQARWEEERRLVEAQLFEAKERIEVTLRSIMDAVIATDVEGRIQYVNATAERVTGWSHAETQGRLLNEIFPCLDEYSGALLDPVGRCLDGSAVGPEDALLFRRDGKSLPVERTAAPIRGRYSEVTGVVLVFRDVTEKRVLTERLAYQATHDPLTELPNRALYNTRLERAIAEAKECGACVALLFLDLDGFKGVNDSLGHSIGDRVLVHIAERLKRSVRATDTLARLGGDEFAIVLPGLKGRHEALPVVHKIMATFREAILTLPEEIFLSASIGIAIYPVDNEDAHGLSRSADAAMYEAKAAGKNTYRFFKANMRDQAVDRLSLDAHLHRALDRDEFRLVYQPQVRLSNSEIAGVEVLLRWVHPTEGWKYPAEFLVAADEAGLMVRLGAWVLHSACAQMSAWRTQGLACVPVAVNMTGRQCRHDGTPRLIEGVLREYQLRPQDLIVELTEGFLADESESLLTTLQAFKDRGLGLVIQNFGAGFSSLRHLKRVRVDGLKIDRSFVAGIGEPGNEAVVLAIIALGRALDIQVIAGGVE
ncbi:MAG: bifunctional diguanylate cyclase/phosphodiesterase, partial [Acidiferrobacter sp.]